MEGDVADSMSRRRRIWLFSPGRFYAHLVPMLADRGIYVSYVCAAPRVIGEFRYAAGCTLHSTADALAGKDPAGRPIDTPAPDPELLAQLRECELVTMQMLERVNYFNYRLRELRQVYLRYVSYWYARLTAERPDAVLFVAVPHMAYDYVLYHLCSLLGVRTLITERTSIPDRLFLFERIDERPGAGDSDRIPAQPMPPAPDSTEVLREERDYYARRARTFGTAEPDGGAIGLALALLRHTMRVGRNALMRISDLHRPHQDGVYALWYARYGRMPRLAAHLWHQFRDGLVMHYTRWRYGRLAEAPDLSRDYVYFPLHLQPERSVLPMAVSYPDQLSALRVIAESLPPGWLLYVKEHPRQFWDPLRFRIARGGIDFYRAVRGAGDRVRLVASNVNGDELVSRARCVATLAGTGGWEAVLKGVPALLFGKPWYLHAPGVREIVSRRECEQALREIASGRFIVALAEVERYRRWVAECGGFRGYFEDVFERLSPITPEENARSHADAIASRLLSDTASLREEIALR